MAVKKRIVIVGLGSIGMRHAKLLCQRPDVELELIEPNKLNLEAAIDILGKLKVWGSYSEMLQSNPEIVWLATPHFLHAEQAISAMRAGAHVFCEKPMTISLKEALRIVECALKTNRIFIVGFQLRFHPGMKLLKDTINSGRLGKVLHAHARVGTYVTLVNSSSRYQTGQTGALFYDYAHQPDILLWLLEKSPDFVFASAMKAGNLPFSSNPNIVDIQCKYENKLMSSIHLNYIQMPERHEYEIIGDSGWALLDMNEKTLKIGCAEKKRCEILSFDNDRDEVYKAEQQAFMELVHKKVKMDSKVFEEAIAVVAFCDAVFSSWQKKSPVKINKFPLGIDYTRFNRKKTGTKERMISYEISSY